MFYTKRKSYSGRWLVKLLQAALVLGVIFFGLDALGQWLNPVADADNNSIMIVRPDSNSQEDSFQPILEEARNADYAMDAEGYFYEALVHQEASEYNEAIVDYTRAIELDEEIAASWLNRGVAYEQLGQSYRALSDFNQYLMRDEITVFSQPLVDSNNTFTVEMYEGYRYDFPIELAVGEVLSISVTSVEEDLVDPLILLVNDSGTAIAGNDDVLRQDGSFISMNSYIHSYTVTRSGVYTLYVSHAGGGSYGAMEVKINID